MNTTLATINNKVRVKSRSYFVSRISVRKERLTFTFGAATGLTRVGTAGLSMGAFTLSVPAMILWSGFGTDVLISKW